MGACIHQAPVSSRGFTTFLRVSLVYLVLQLLGLTMLKCKSESVLTETLIPEYWSCKRL